MPMKNDGENYADVDAAAAAGAPGRDEPPQPRAEPLDPRDERLHDDPFGPPKTPCECYCLHCQRTFMSSEIWFQRIKNAQPGKLDGFWMCPTPNCDGKGFTFDIFPTDPDHPANEGWSYDDEDEDYDDDADDEEWDQEFDAAASAEELHAEYDPNETKWKQLDEELGDEDDDDIEGEEWKYGLQPGDILPEPEWLSAGRREREEEERRYDQPDERPREIEWEYGEGFNEDDIPF
jgi:hypothetical protein